MRCIMKSFFRDQIWGVTWYTKSNEIWVYTVIIFMNISFENKNKKKQMYFQEELKKRIKNEFIGLIWPSANQYLFVAWESTWCV